MTTINVKDAVGSIVAVQMPQAPGQALSADSRPVVIASDQSAIHGIVTNAGTFAVQDTVLDAALVSQGTALGTIKNAMVAGSVTTAAATYTAGQINPLSLDTTGALRVNVTAGGAGGGIVTNAGTFAVQDTVLDAAIVSQGTALGAIKQQMIAGSVTTAAPTYTTGQINPLSLDTTGSLRVNV